MTLREQIEEIACRYNSQFAEPDKFTDEILALLRENITLEWEDEGDGSFNASSVLGEYHYEFGTLYCPDGKKRVVDRSKGEEHYRNTIITALGG